MFFTDGSGGDIHPEDLQPQKGRKHLDVKDAGNVAEFVIRLYGALLATQAVLVFAIRNATSDEVDFWLMEAVLRGVHRRFRKPLRLTSD